MRLGDAQADLSFRWAQSSFCWFSHEAAHLYNGTLLVMESRSLNCYISELLKPEAQGPHSPT